MTGDSRNRTRSGRATASITARIRADLSALTPSARRLGEAVLDDPHGVIHLTVTEFAERTATSVATVVRFCQRIGLRGFQDLKIRLATEWTPPAAALIEDVVAGDSPGTVLEKVSHSTSEAISDAAGTVDREAFEEAIAVLAGAAHVLITGVGTSGPLAHDAAYRFRCAGVHAEWPADAHTQHLTARLLTADAACLAISHTGRTRETLATVTAAAAAGATTIAVTSFARSPLADLVDVALVAGCRQTAFRAEPVASRMGHLAVLDALLVAVCLADPERARHSQQLSAEVIAEHRSDRTD